MELENHYQQEKLERQSLLLFDLISECLPHERFTLEDIAEGIANNCRKKGASSRGVENIKFGNVHINYLIENGYLNFDAIRGNYSINISSPFVSQRLISDELISREGEDEEQRQLKYEVTHNNRVRALGIDAPRLKTDFD